MENEIKQASTTETAATEQTKPSRRRFLKAAATAGTGAAITGFPMIAVAQSPVVFKM